MAFDDSQNQSQDNEQINNNSVQALGNPNVQLSGGGGFAGSSGASATGTPGSYSQSPTSSGQWTNVNSYLNANSDQAPALGQTIAGNVSGQAAQAQSDLGSVVSGFQNQNPYQNLNNTTSSQVDQAFSDPSQYAATSTNGVSTPADISKPESYLNNTWGVTPQSSDITQYSGAAGSPNWGTVQSDYTTANQNLQNTQSEAGRDNLLSNQYGKNGQTYNTGEQSFDQLLLQGNPDNQTALNNVYNQYSPGESAQQSSAATGGMPLDLYNATQGAQAYNTQEQNKATGFQTQANTDLGNQITGLNNNIAGEVNSDNANFGTPYNQLKQALQSGILSSAQVQQLGIGSDVQASNPGLFGNAGITTYGVDPGAYLKESLNPYTGAGASNAAATSGDWNNFSGLRALVGGYTGPNQASAQAQLSQNGLTGTQATAPTVSGTPYNFDSTGFNQATAAQLTQNKQNLADIFAKEKQDGLDGVSYLTDPAWNALEYKPSTNNYQGWAGGGIKVNP